MDTVTVPPQFVPSRVNWVAIDMIDMTTVTVTRTDTAYGQLHTASVGDVLLEAALCGTPACGNAWFVAVRERFAPTSVREQADRRWWEQMLSYHQPISVAAPTTLFRRTVHTALTTIAPGSIVSYRDVARLIGKPNATRAVASAIAANTVAIVIPCHRVWRSEGTVGGFRWGSAVKQQLCQDEQACHR